jgi:hypothetical protein
MKCLQRPQSSGTGNVRATLSDISEENSTDGRNENDRRDFDKIYAIPNVAFEDLVFSVFSSYIDSWRKPKSRDQVRLLYRTEGSFNQIAVVGILMTRDGVDELDQYAVKVPFHGTPEYWTAEDAYMLRNEAELMDFLCRTMPVPVVFKYDTTLSNGIGAPFIIMKKFPGIPAHRLWNDIPHRAKLDQLVGRLKPLYLDASIPSEELEQKRITFLGSLARWMARLNELKFEMIGVPLMEGVEYEYDEDFKVVPAVYTVGHVFQWHTKLNAMAMRRRQSVASSKDFFLGQIDRAHYGKEFDGLSGRELGERKVLEIVF